jgi:triphosphatase
MTQPREIELKLELPVHSLARLLRSPLLRNTRKGTQQSASLVSVYYDTRNRKLRRHGLTLRVRRTGPHYTQTVKGERHAGSALMDRFEWEHDIAGEKPNLDLAGDSGLKPILTKALQAKLMPLFETRVRRTSYTIRRGGSEISLSIDRGIVAAGLLPAGTHRQSAKWSLSSSMATPRSCSRSPKH